MSTPSTYATRDALLSALTTAHERTINIPGAGELLIRELTARERAAISEAARDEAGALDDELWAALLVQRCVVDPATGTPDATGYTDPRTRAPLFTPEDVAAIADGRWVWINQIREAILNLSALSSDALKSRHRAHDGGESDARPGAGAGGADAAGDAAG